MNRELSIKEKRIADPERSGFYECVRKLIILGPSWELLWKSILLPFYQANGQSRLESLQIEQRGSLVKHALLAHIGKIGVACRFDQAFSCSSGMIRQANIKVGACLLDESEFRARQRSRWIWLGTRQRSKTLHPMNVLHSTSLGALRISRVGQPKIWLGFEQPGCGSTEYCW